MTLVCYVIFYSCGLIFALACLARIRMYARAPLHLRWEVYPVPHERPDRAKHGGSRFEEVDWWHKPDRAHLAGELRFMIPEILFLKGLHEFNRKVWYCSFPFHFGLYLLAGTTVLLLAGAALLALAPGWAAPGFVKALRILCAATGFSGLVLALLGACALMARRLSKAGLRDHTTAGDICNLCFFIVASGWLTAALLLKPASAPDMLAIAKGALTFDAGLQIPALLGAGLVLAALLVAYIPLTHMSHFIAKYFTYHSVRWDDAPNPRGGRLEARLAEYLTYRPTWSAAHMGADGRKTWAEVVAANPNTEEKQ